jgi:hypothetical protein
MREFIRDRKGEVLIMFWPPSIAFSKALRSNAADKKCEALQGKVQTFRIILQAESENNDRDL